VNEQLDRFKNEIRHRQIIEEELRQEAENRQNKKTKKKK